MWKQWAKVSDGRAGSRWHGGVSRQVRVWQGSRGWVSWPREQSMCSDDALTGMGYNGKQ